MKISVITPNYNYGKYLKKAIASIQSQVAGDGSPFEVEHIVVDGGSSDVTLELLREHEATASGIAGYSFRWISEPDKGQTDAINKGLRMATGDIVCWLNADEYYLPGALGKVVAAFGKNPGTDFIYGEPLFVDSDGRASRIKRDHTFSGFVLLWYGCYIASCCSFWRRRIIDEGVYLDDSYKVIMDGEYWVRIMKLGYRFKFIPVTIAAFTWHNTNISTIHNDRRIEENQKIKMLYAPMVFGSPVARKWVRKVMRFVAIQWRRLLVMVRLVFLPVEKGPSGVELNR